jgi:hypothetical protein
MARQQRGPLRLATMSGTTAVEVAIIDREGEFLAQVGG